MAHVSTCFQDLTLFVHRFQLFSIETMTTTQMDCRKVCVLFNLSQTYFEPIYFSFQQKKSMRKKLQYEISNSISFGTQHMHCLGRINSLFKVMCDTNTLMSK